MTVATTDPITDADPMESVADELRDRLAILRGRGVVDIKSVCSPDITMPAKLWTLNNVIRQYLAGAGETKTIAPVRR